MARNETLRTCHHNGHLRLQTRGELLETGGGAPATTPVPLPPSLSLSLSLSPSPSFSLFPSRFPAVPFSLSLSLPVTCTSGREMHDVGETQFT